MKQSWVTLRMNRILLACLLILSAQSMSAAGAEEDYRYKVMPGDTLIGLSGRLLNTPDDWPKIARINRLSNANYIVPGSTLRIPFDLLKANPVTATVTHVEGDVKVAPASAGTAAVVALGATLAEGAQVITGKNGYLTLKLHDGSIVKVQSGSQLLVERSRTYAGAGLFESAMKLMVGRVESLVQKFAADKTPTHQSTETRHGVKTPLANLAVRGTEFRVTMDTQNNNTRGEVLSGVVAVSSDAAAAKEKRLNAGFGSVVDSTKSCLTPLCC